METSLRLVFCKSTYFLSGYSIAKLFNINFVVNGY